MMEAMRPLAITILALAGLVAASAGHPSLALADCSASWSKSKFKSYSQVQADVRGQFGEVRILKVALCNQGAKPYFQIVVMDDKGVVRTLHIGAQENNSLLPRSNAIPDNDDASSEGVTPPPPPPMPLVPPQQAK
jgi:hypothetical protein